ncbi:GDP-mannose 4,6-dehydratase [Sneathiella glossodoripedis]|uniref:GDP-mannose 4,6-dehydratase n=1 Tax=Sneathiella glossodoripedis TaxID=418853 RepID=UPI000472CCBA|nr:GDP-mannose 4,6-dehydratase [Sneathiella glossodoripedis]
MAMKFAVLGSNSFSGASFCAHLIETGIDVIGISRSVEPHDAFLPYKWVQSRGSFSFHQLDLNNDLDKIIDIIKSEKIEFIVNFASQSMVGESWQNPGDWFRTNTLSTVLLHDELRKLDFLKRYVHISTPEVYGNTSGSVNEQHAFNPSTPYAVSRAAGDMNLISFYKAYKFPFVMTRAANVYGPGQQLYRIIPRTILFALTGQKLQLHGGGSSERSFIHINDVSNATLKIALEGEVGECYHISTNSLISIRNLVEKICQTLSINPEDMIEVVGERQGKDQTYSLNDTKLRKTLSWNDEIDLDTGIHQTVNWVKDNLKELIKQPQSYIHKP